MYTIGILYICTGKYNIFWKGFYTSSEQFLLPDCRKTYFVFTDADSIFAEEKESVVKIKQKNLGWPGGTLMRFEMFRKIENDLKQFDFLFFFNSDMLLNDFVREEEILPHKEGLTALNHPNFYDKDNFAFPYERNPNSLAFIPFGLGTYYYFGSLSGGKATEFLNMIKTLEEAILTDLSNGVIATWYDESHLNKYLLNKHVKVLSPSYGYPEGFSIPFYPKIIKRDKISRGGLESFRSNY